MRNPAWSMACPRRPLIVDLPFVWSGWMPWQTLCRHRACRIVDGALAPVLAKTARPRFPARISFHITDSIGSDILKFCGQVLNPNFLNTSFAHRQEGFMEQFASLIRSKDGQPVRYLVVADSVF